MNTLITKHYLYPNGIIRTIEPKVRPVDYNEWIKHIREQIMKLKIG